MAKFVDELPPSTRGGVSRGRYVRLATDLRKQPGRWAQWPKKVAPEYARALAWGVNSSRSPAPISLRSGGFEAAVRQSQLFVRFNGA